MASDKKIGLITCTGIVAGNMMCSGIALLPANLSAIGSITLIGWLIALPGALGLAWVYAYQATTDPQEGGPIAYAGELSKVFGFQTGVLYYHSNWIGNLACGITAVAYLSYFFPELQSPRNAGFACIGIVWLLTFVNMLGAKWIGRFTTIGLIAVLIPVVGTAVAGWFWFDPQTYVANWNETGKSSWSAVSQSVLLCLWAFVGVESAAVSTHIVRNPRKTIPIATLLGTLIAGVVYIASSQVVCGMYPAEIIANSGAPFAIAASTIAGPWAAPIVAGCTAFASLASLASWMMLVSHAGARASKDGTFPSIYGEIDRNGIPRKGLVLGSIKMTVMMLVIVAINWNSSGTAVLFESITGIAVLLLMLPYFYSGLNLIRKEGAQQGKAINVVAAVVACSFCLVAIAGASQMRLALTLITSLTVLIFYAWRTGLDASRFASSARSLIQAGDAMRLPGGALTRVCKEDDRGPWL